MDIKGLPQHLVLFYLWRAAQPEKAAVNRDPQRIGRGVDAQFYLDEQQGSEKHFVWLDGRPMFLTLRRSRVTIREYDSYNGRGTAKKAIELLRRAIAWYEEELGSRDAAIAHLTEAHPQNLNISVERVFPPGQKLFEDLFDRE